MDGGANSQSFGCCVYLTTLSNLTIGREHSVAMSSQSRGSTRESAESGIISLDLCNFRGLERIRPRNFKSPAMLNSCFSLFCRSWQFPVCLGGRTIPTSRDDRGAYGSSLRHDKCHIGHSVGRDGCAAIRKQPRRPPRTA
jgi:hypothetical protein